MPGRRRGAHPGDAPDQQDQTLARGRDPIAGLERYTVIQPQTRLRVADNTGAKQIMCIRVMGGSNRRYAGVGDIIIAAVKVATPGGAVKKGEVVRAVVVRTAKEYGRPDGSHIRFDDNAAVLHNPQNNPLGMR